MLILFALLPGALTRGPRSTFGTGPGNFLGARIFEKVEQNVNNELCLSFLFVLLTNA